MENVICETILSLFLVLWFSFLVTFSEILGLFINIVLLWFFTLNTSARTVLQAHHNLLCHPAVLLLREFIAYQHSTDYVINI